MQGTYNTGVAAGYEPIGTDYEDFGIDGDLSAPSSFRRLRKSRSMLTTKSMRNLRAAGAPASHSEEAESPSLRKSTDHVLLDSIQPLLVSSSNHGLYIFFAVLNNHWVVCGRLRL